MTDASLTFRNATDCVAGKYQSQGSVGDLSIQHLRSMATKAGARVWVVGCFDKPPHPPADAAAYQNELFALGRQLVWMGVKARMGRAKVCFLRVFRRR